MNYEQIAAEMVARGWSRAELARRAGLSQATLWSWSKGKPVSPRSEIAVRAALDNPESSASVASEEVGTEEALGETVMVLMPADTWRVFHKALLAVEPSVRVIDPVALALRISEDLRNGKPVQE